MGAGQRVGFEGVGGASWSEGNRGDGSNGFDGAMGTTTLVDLVRRRFLTFWETSVQVIISPLLKGILPTKTR